MHWFSLFSLLPIVFVGVTSVLCSGNTRNYWMWPGAPALARSLEDPVQNHSTPVPTCVQKRHRQVLSPSCEAQLKHWLLFAAHIRPAPDIWRQAHVKEAVAEVAACLAKRIPRHSGHRSCISNMTWTRWLCNHAYVGDIHVDSMLGSFTARAWARCEATSGFRRLVRAHSTT
jgi:hypothetical protein